MLPAVITKIEGVTAKTWAKTCVAVLADFRQHSISTMAWSPFDNDRKSHHSGGYLLRGLGHAGVNPAGLEL